MAESTSRRLGIVRGLLLISLGLLTSWATARAIVTVSQEGFGLGVLMRASSIPALFAVALAAVYAWRGQRWPAVPELKLGLSPGQALLVLALALGIASMLPDLANVAGSATVFLFVLAVVVGFGLALCFCVIGKTLDGVITYVLTWPFIAFLENEWGVSLAFDLGSVSRAGALLSPPSRWNVPLQLGGGTFHMHISQFMLVLFAIWLARRALNKQPLIGTSVYWLMGLWVAAGLFSVFFSSDPIKSASSLLHQVTSPSLFFVLVLNIVRTRDEIVKLCGALAVATALTVVFHEYMYLYREGYATLSGRALIESAGYLGGRIVLTSTISVVFMLMLPLIVGLWLVAKSTKQKGMWIGVLLCTITGLVLTFQRSAWLVSAVAILPFVFLAQGRRFLLFLLAITVFLTSFFPGWVSEYGLRFQTIIEKGFLADHAIQTRLQAWQAALEMAKDYPFHGVGLGTYKDHYLEYGPPYYYRTARGYVPGPYPHAHSQVLNFAAETGLPGSLAFLLLIFGFFIAGMKVWRRARSDPLIAGLGGSLIAIELNAFMGSWIRSEGPNQLTALAVVALIVTVDKMQTTSGEWGGMSEN